jgi:hypothetical protein
MNTTDMPEEDEGTKPGQIEETISNLPESAISLTETPPANMEVHHHPEIEKKGLKEYLLEGLMIFLAVTMGFIAENVREKITDKSKEKEYIIAMIEDAETDTANIQSAIELNDKRSYQLDSLATICNQYSASQNADPLMYRLYMAGMRHPSFVSPTERTLSQLKNSGGMRLIRVKSATDSIVQYDDMARKLIDQQAYYELYQNKTIDMAVQIFNFQYFQFRTGKKPWNLSPISSEARLLSQDKLKLIEFANLISAYKGIVGFYIIRLQEMNDHATNLITTLKKDYDIE